MTHVAGYKVSIGAKEIFDLLANVEVLLSLACFIPLLDVVYHLMKLSQEKDIFICDFMQVVKVCQGELARRFIDAPSTYSTNDFLQYHDILSMHLVNCLFCGTQCLETVVSLTYILNLGTRECLLVVMTRVLER